MEKLKPLIIYRFWIILGLVLLLPPIGWMSATGKLEAHIASRISTLDGLKGAVPSGQGAPNDDWSQQADKLVKNREVRNQVALKVLWDSQVRTRVWSPAIGKFMAKCPYRGELEDRNEKERVPDLFRDNYDNEVSRVWKIPFPRQDLTDPSRAKIVDFPGVRMPRIPSTTWRGIVPTWPEMWNASEDLWLLEQLLSAVQRTNSYATNLIDANVKEIEVVELFGGRRLGPTDAPVSGGTLGLGMESSMGSPGSMSSSSMMAGPGGATTAAAYIPATSAEFNIGDEYEVKNRLGATTGANSLMQPGSESMQSSANPMPSSGSSSMPGAAVANAGEGRYVQDTPAFRTRGFRLKVTVRQQNAMELVRELLNSKYPIEIVRIQQFARNPAFGSTAGAGGMQFGSGGGFGAFPMPVGGGFGADTTVSGSELGVGNADPLAGLGAPSSDTSSSGASSPQDAMVYQDPHLVSLVILGELYIYNEPKLPNANPDAPAASTDPAATGAVNPDAAAGTPENPAATTEGQTPGSSTPVGSGDPATAPAPAAVPMSPPKTDAPVSPQSESN